MPGNDKETPAQAKALQELRGLIGKERVGGRTLCCLVGQQGSGKTWLAKNMLSLPEFGETKYITVNQLILDMLEHDSLFREIFEFNNLSLCADIQRYGTRLRRAVHDLVAEQFLPEGLTILDHLELVFALGIDPITTWYNDAVGNRRILLVLMGRMAGQHCRCGQHTLTRGDQTIVELEA
jgi:hypothetical protein